MYTKFILYLYLFIVFSSSLIGCKLVEDSSLNDTGKMETETVNVSEGQSLINERKKQF